MSDSADQVLIAFGVTFTSSLISCVAAVLLVLILRRNNRETLDATRELPLQSANLLLYLTIADFFTASGNMIGITRYAFGPNSTCPSIVDHNSPNKERPIDWVCTLQSFITTTSSMSSFLWTGMIALYYLIKIRKPQFEAIDELLSYFHSICFGLPVIITIIALSIGALGDDPDPKTSGGWCWIDGCGWTPTQGLALRLWTGKFWEITMYIFICIISILVLYKRLRRRGNFMIQENQGAEDITPVESLFFVMPWLLCLCRAAGTLRFFIWINQVLIKKIESLEKVDAGLLYVQGFGDSSQATINFLLVMYFCVGARVYVRSLLSCLFCNRCRTRVQAMASQS